MEIKIILINAMKYKDKTTGEEKTRISYIPVDKGALQSGINFKGYTDIGGYSNRTDILDKLQESDFMNQAILIGEEVTNARNPFKKSMRLKQLVTKNATIDLL